GQRGRTRVAGVVLASDAIGIERRAPRIGRVPWCRRARIPARMVRCPLMARCRIDLSERSGRTSDQQSGRKCAHNDIPTHLLLQTRLLLECSYLPALWDAETAPRLRTPSVAGSEFRENSW